MISLPRLITYAQILFVNVVDMNILQFGIFVAALVVDLQGFDGSNLVVVVWMIHATAIATRVNGQM